MFKMLVSGEHAIIRKGVLRILDENLGLPVQCEEAASAEETERKASTGEYALVLQALSAAREDGVELRKKLHRKMPHLPILVLSDPCGERGPEAPPFGASGYLTTASAPEELVAAVQRILAGGTVTGTPEEAASREKILPRRALSEREDQILRMIASGKTPTQIAKELMISVKTISTYRSRILHKTGLRSTAQLMHYVFKNNFLE